jgi:hypothetical protein
MKGSSASLACFEAGLANAQVILESREEIT